MTWSKKIPTKSFHVPLNFLENFLCVQESAVLIIKVQNWHFNWYDSKQLVCLGLCLWCNWLNDFLRLHFAFNLSLPDVQNVWPTCSRYWQCKLALEDLILFFEMQLWAVQKLCKKPKEGMGLSFVFQLDKNCSVL